MYLKCGILEFGMCLYKGFDEKIEKYYSNEEPDVLPQGFHSLPLCMRKATSSSPKSPSALRRIPVSDICGCIGAAVVDADDLSHIAMHLYGCLDVLK